MAAARALEVSQANDVVSQFGKNQDAAMGALGLEEVQLAHAQDLLQRVRELAVQAGSTSLTPTARKGIATELRGTYDQLLGIANTKDAAGNHLFGGYMSLTVKNAEAEDLKWGGKFSFCWAIVGGSIDALVAGGGNHLPG